jgi:prepilin-type N-terminal cleavage/methylation domain-containing protein
MNRKAFTLVEVMVVIVIVAIVVAIVIPWTLQGGKMTQPNNITWGMNGMTETRCIEGYKFIVGRDGRSTQIMDQFGKGISCK